MIRSYTFADLLLDAPRADTEVFCLAPAQTLEDHLVRRRALAFLVKLEDTAIAQLTDTIGPPFVVVRDDGAVYLGHQLGYGHDVPPYRFLYRGAAMRRAESDGGVVLPFSTWTNNRTMPSGAIK